MLRIDRPVYYLPMAHDTAQRLLDAGIHLMLRHGYNATGIHTVLQLAGVPKGSFYHHFPTKQVFALEALRHHASRRLEQLDAVVSDDSRSPLDRIRRFLELEKARLAQDDCRAGSLLGMLGQELAATSRTFRELIEEYLQALATRFESCLFEAVELGEIPPWSDLTQRANVLVDGWEGAILRMKTAHNTAPLDAFIHFFFDSVEAG